MNINFTRKLRVTSFILSKFFCSLLKINSARVDIEIKILSCKIENPKR